MPILFKRLLDPNLHSPNSWLFDGRISGIDSAIQQAAKMENLITISRLQGYKHQIVILW